MNRLVLFCTLLLIVTFSARAQTPLPVDASPEVTPEVTAETTPETTPILVNPLLGLPVLPPLAIDLPASWGAYYDTYIYTELDGRVETLPLAFYQGPVTGGVGNIVLLWGFDSFVGAVFEQAPDPWLDGLRLLQPVVFSPECNVGRFPKRDYRIGAFDAVGAQFTAIDCPNEAPDTRGWFAATTYEGLNFAFYAYIDPLQPAGSQAEFDLQAILDSVRFDLDAYQEIIPELTPEVTAPVTPEDD